MKGRAPVPRQSGWQLWDFASWSRFFLLSEGGWHTRIGKAAQGARARRCLASGILPRHCALMNADELKETTMDKSNRILKRVSVEDGEEADRVFDMLMGTDVPARKAFITSNAKLAQIDL